MGVDYSNVETNYRSPTMGTVQQIADIFDVPINDLVNVDLENYKEVDKSTYYGAMTR